MTVVDWRPDSGLLHRVKRFAYRHALKLLFLGCWGVLFWIGEVILRYGV